MPPPSVSSAALVLSQAASAESKQDWDDCTSSDADVSLAGCSKIIGRAKDTKNNLAIAYFNRGIAYQNKGDHAKAIAEFNQSIKLNASDPAAYRNRGYSYCADRRVRPRHRRLQSDHQAQADYAEASITTAAGPMPPSRTMPARSTITTAPSSWIRTITTSSTIAVREAAPMPELGDLDKALADFDKAIALKPDYALGHSNRGWVLAQRNKHDEAVAEYERGDPAGAGQPRQSQRSRLVADQDRAI